MGLIKKLYAVINVCVERGVISVKILVAVGIGDHGEFLEEMILVNTVADILEIFREVFFCIALVAFIFMVSFSLRSLRRKMREIGVMRALGARTGQIVICFAWQMEALWMLVVALSFVAYPMIVNNANSLLVDKMAELLNAPMIGSLTVLSASPISLLAVFAVFLPILLLALLVPLIFVRRVKPIKIIRSSDS